MTISTITCPERPARPLHIFGCVGIIALSVAFPGQAAHAQGSDDRASEDECAVPADEAPWWCTVEEVPEEQAAPPTRQKRAAPAPDSSAQPATDATVPRVTIQLVYGSPVTGRLVQDAPEFIKITTDLGYSATYKKKDIKSISYDFDQASPTAPAAAQQQPVAVTPLAPRPSPQAEVHPRLDISYLAPNRYMMGEQYMSWSQVRPMLQESPLSSEYVTKARVYNGVAQGLAWTGAAFAFSGLVLSLTADPEYYSYASISLAVTGLGFSLSSLPFSAASTRNRRAAVNSHQLGVSFASPRGGGVMMSIQLTPARSNAAAASSWRSSPGVLDMWR